MSRSTKSGVRLTKAGRIPIGVNEGLEHVVPRTALSEVNEAEKDDKVSAKD